MLKLWKKLGSEPESLVGKPPFLPQSLGDFYPQAGGLWRPQGVGSFIGRDVPMAPSLSMSRTLDEIPH